MKKSSAIRISGLIGSCGHLRVFLGFAAARVLHAASFTDVLNEDTGEGYQRPRNVAHSRSFRQYISRPGTSTIPLTFNLRRELAKDWQIEADDSGRATLSISRGVRCLAQVDCQHRLGELQDADIPLAFMSFIDLSLREEMALFNVINSKAKGLSSSLTDYHESNLLTDLVVEAPHLFIARKLNEDSRSPWHRLVRYGGETTSGLHRRTSLRMMQKSIQRFLKQTKELPLGDIEQKYRLILAFWQAVKDTFPAEWNAPRHHLITKGVGLYSLMQLLADLVKCAGGDLTPERCRDCLALLRGKIDWDSQGMFAEAGGQKGAMEVYQTLRKAAGL